MKLRHLFIAFCFILCGLVWVQADSLFAQSEGEETERPFTIMVYVGQPWFYEQPEGHYTGFIAELWEAIATEIDLEYELVLGTTLDEATQALKDGRIDAIIAPVAMTPDREAIMDFTYPIIETSSQIVMPANSTNAISYIKLIRNSGIVKTMGIALVVLFVMANMLWLAEYRHEESDFSHKYLHGIWEAMWWAIVTATTVGYGDITPKRTLGRILGLFWILGSLFFVSLFAAQIMSSLTAQKLNSSFVNSPNDLHGLTVGSLGEASATYLDEQGIDNIVYPYEVLMFSALENGRIDAVVGEKASMAYYATTDGRGKVTLAGPPFNQSYAGFALPEDSPNLEPINDAILTLRDNGLYDQIHDHYFDHTK